jgi:hypothetical protein
MKNDNFVQDVLKTIQDKNIKPKAKWEFIVRNWLVLFVGLIFLIIGSLAFSVIIYLLKNNDWDLRMQIGHSLISFVLLSLPYLWLIFLIIFIAIIYYDFKHSKKGYRYDWKIVVGSIVLISILFGILLYNVGVGQAIEDTLTNKVPLYQKMMQHRTDMWQRPEKGILPGTIIKVKSDKLFILKDLRNKEWNVQLETDFIPMKALIQPGEKVKVMGEEINKDSFKAIQIRPLFGPGGGLKGQVKGMHLPPRSR